MPSGVARNEICWSLTSGPGALQALDMPQMSTDVDRCRQSRFVGILMEFNGILNGIQVTRTAAYANKVGGGGFERAWPLLALRDSS